MGTTLCRQERVNLATDQLAAISKLFSSSVVRAMARKGKSPLFARLVAQSQLFGSISVQTGLCDLRHRFFASAARGVHLQGSPHA
jgi:hypothetical protein